MEKSMKTEMRWYHPPSFNGFTSHSDFPLPLASLPSVKRETTLEHPRNSKVEVCDGWLAEGGWWGICCRRKRFWVFVVGGFFFSRVWKDVAASARFVPGLATHYDIVFKECKSFPILMSNFPTEAQSMCWSRHRGVAVPSCRTRPRPMHMSFVYGGVREFLVSNRVTTRYLSKYSIPRA